MTLRGSENGEADGVSKKSKTEVFKDAAKAAKTGFVEDLKSGIGGLGGKSKAYFRHDSNSLREFGLAQNNYYYTNTPRLKFQYFAVVHLNEDLKDFTNLYLNNNEIGMLMPLTHSIKLPDMTVDHAVLNQYNRKRINLKKVTYEPIEMVMHDVVDGKTLRLWEMYNEYYFKDFTQNGVIGDPKRIGSAVVKEGTLSQKAPHTEFGYYLNDEIQLIQSIEIYQVHASRYSKTTIVNPKITKFQHDNLDFSETATTCKITYTITGEFVLYDNFASTFDLSKLTEALNRGKNRTEPYPKPAAINDFTVRRRKDGDEKLAGATKPPDTSIWGNIKRGASGILGAAPDLISGSVSSSIMTGKFVAPGFDYKSAANVFKNNVVGGATTVGLGALGAGAGAITQAAVGAIPDFGTDQPPADQQPPEEEP